MGAFFSSPVLVVWALAAAVLSLVNILPAGCWAQQVSHGANDEVVFIHIPKTAGTSLRLELNKSGYDVSHTEQCFQTLFKTQAFTITYSRSPRSHVLSQYFECAYDKWGQKRTRGTMFPRNTDDPMEGFIRWIEHFYALQVGDSETNVSTPIELAFKCYDPRNLQTRQMSTNCDHDPHYFQELVKDDLDDAIANMNSLSFVGIAELYALSWCVLVFKLTGNVHHTCLNHDVEGESKSHMHITHGVPKHDEFPDGLWCQHVQSIIKEKAEGWSWSTEVL